jgi:hypothetical protein
MFEFLNAPCGIKRSQLEDRTTRLIYLGNQAVRALLPNGENGNGYAIATLFCLLVMA